MNGDHDIFFKSVVSEKLRLRPHELHRNYKDVLLQKLRACCEGRCTRHGYVRRGSVQLIKVSTGRIDTSSLNGDVTFTVLYRCDVCNPWKGSVIPTTVVNTNKFGILAQSGTTYSPQQQEREHSKYVPVIEVVIPRQVFRSEVDLDRVSVGDALLIEVLGKKFRLNGTKIQVTARAIAHNPPPASEKPSLIRDDPVGSELVVTDDAGDAEDEQLPVDEEESIDEEGDEGDVVTDNMEGGDARDITTKPKVVRRRDEGKDRAPATTATGGMPRGATAVDDGYDEDEEEDDDMENDDDDEENDDEDDADADDEDVDAPDHHHHRRRIFKASNGGGVAASNDGNNNVVIEGRTQSPYASTASGGTGMASRSSLLRTGAGIGRARGRGRGAGSARAAARDDTGSALSDDGDDSLAGEEDDAYSLDAAGEYGADGAEESDRGAGGSYSDAD